MVLQCRNVLKCANGMENSSSPDPEVIKLLSYSAEHEILNSHKYKNIKKCSFLGARISFECYIWLFNIYEQENFHAQLS